jgi:hypothetical protein
MPLATAGDFIRKIDLSGYTGDAWAGDATLAEPSATSVPRMIANGAPVEWVVYAMSSMDASATQVIDTTTTITTRMVKLATTPGTVNVLVRPLDGASGTILSKPITEDDVRHGDVFVLAISAISVGTASYLWIVPHSGFSQVPQ